jgi:hypothetical protein
VKYKQPSLVITHYNMHSTVKCSCGFSGWYGSRFSGMRAVYASSLATGVASRHVRRDHDDNCKIQEYMK